MSYAIVRRRGLGEDFTIGLPIVGNQNVSIPISQMMQSAIASGWPTLQSKLSSALPGLVSSAVSSAAPLLQRQVTDLLPMLQGKLTDMAPGLVSQAGQVLLTSAWPQVKGDLQSQIDSTKADVEAQLASVKKVFIVTSACTIGAVILMGLIK